jgi:hypothetical protein
VEQDSSVVSSENQLATFVEGDCLICFIPSLGNTASSLFRPRRDILAVFDGVFFIGALRMNPAHIASDGLVTLVTSKLQFTRD